MASSRWVIQFVLLAAVVGLTLTTAYIHFWVGGVLLLLNAAGYVGLAIVVVGSAIVFRRALPLLLVTLAAYAATTIAGWLVVGPYFDVAYIAKGVEIALIVTISLTLRAFANETRAAVAWARSLLGNAMRIRRRGAAALSASSAADE
jgi:hypothetical protein